MRAIPLFVLFTSFAVLAQPPRRPVVRQRVEPEYTADARAAGLQGTVSVYLEIDEQGKPDRVALLQGLGLGLDEKAVEAVKQWRFEPSQGAPRVAQAVDIPFRLNSGRGWRILQAAYTVYREDRYHSEPVVKPVLTHYTHPPDSACVEGQGPVRLELNVGKDGRPSKILVVDRTSPMAKAVEDAAASWSFQHALGSSEPRAADAFFLLECGSSAAAIVTGPARLGPGISAPVLLSKVEPEYSEEARKIKFQGTVRVHLEVDTEGIPVNLMVSPSTLLAFSALEAVKRWRFLPATNAGKPVTVMATVDVNFRLL